MKKQFVIIGILALLVGVGLSGCNSKSDLTSIPTIRSHVDTYIGKTVTIKGTCNGGDNNAPYMIFDSNYNNMYAMNSDNVVKPSKLYSTVTYTFTGMVRDREDTNQMILAEYYLEVTKIETT